MDPVELGLPVVDLAKRGFPAHAGMDPISAIAYSKPWHRPVSPPTRGWTVDHGQLLRR